MFENYSFQVLRLRYVKGAMDLIASYRPDGKTPAEVGTMVTNATGPTSARAVYEGANATLQLAQGEYDEDIAEGPRHLRAGVSHPQEPFPHRRRQLVGH